MPETYPQETIEKLVDESLGWEELRTMMSAFKDDNRFQQYREVLQERVDWDDPIVLPYAEHLYVVAKPNETWMIKCDCGHEFCEHDENWKLDALINVRDSTEEFDEIYPQKMGAAPGWNELREYFCPECKTQLEVESSVPWYPVVHNFEPDIETFYREWIEEPIPSVE